MNSSAGGSSGLQRRGPERRGAPRLELLDLDDPQAVATWTRSLNISEEELRRAVDLAGPEIGAVYDQIQRSKQLRG